MGGIRAAIAGAGGRMGQTLARLIPATPGFELVGALEAPGSARLGQDIGAVIAGAATGVVVTDDPEAAFSGADVIIDFTVPAASLATLIAAERFGKALVVGTTGFSADDDRAYAAAGAAIPIVKSGNFSVGVNVLATLVRQAAKALDEDFDIEIVEMHHNQKIDAPSGTALLLGEAAAKGRGFPLADAMESGRHGHTGARKRGAIGFAALRGGAVVGDHSVILAGPTERIVLSHVAQDRGLFARGALKATIYAAAAKPGLYSMADVLGLDAG